MLALEIRGLSKKFANGVHALDQIFLDVQQGDFFALLGPNGAGKSTLISVITSLLIKDSGSIKVFSYDLDKEVTQAKLQIGIVPQELNFSIFESVWNIVINQGGFYGMSKALLYEHAEILLKRLKLWEKRHQPSMSLSGGMKRRLMIARALIHQPRLLILDEPTAGVDVELRKSMWDFLTELNRDGLTIILTTHYLEEAEQLCKNVAIINHGKILEQSSIQDFLEKSLFQIIIFEIAATTNLQNKQLPKEILILNTSKLEIKIHRTFTLYDAMKILQENKIQIRHIQNKSNRLEELFMQEIQEKNEQ